jgi:hypothetical protein
METIDALDSVMDIFLNQPCMSGLDHIVAILSWLMALPETQALLILIKAWALTWAIMQALDSLVD